MLIAIAGSQGSGKSTIIQNLKDKGESTIERKTSRSILQDWDVSLSEVNDSAELTIKFQNEITKRKWDDEAIAMASPNIHFTERSHMDLFTYALISLGKNNKHSDWIDSYYNTCAAYSQAYEHVFFIKAGHFDIQHDGVRGSSQHYSNMVDTIMEKFISQTIKNLTVIDVSRLSDRMVIIQQQVLELRNKHVRQN